MSEIDWVIVVLIAISGVISLARGFFKEAVSLAMWVGAIAITLVFTSRVATLLPADTFESPTARFLISAVVLFFGSMFVGALINWLFRKAVGPSTLGLTDRLLGILFGVGRGWLLVAVLVLLANLVPTLKHEVWWQESTLLPHFQNTAREIHAHLPADLARYFDLDDSDTDI